MVNTLDNAGTLLDSGALNQLKHSAKQQSPETLKAVTKQFEALFLNILTKSLRSTSSGSLLDNQESKLYTELLDQQYAQKIASGRGLGLADALYQQLTRSQIKPNAISEAAGPLPLQAESKASQNGLPLNNQKPFTLKPKTEVEIKPLDASTPPNGSSPRHDFINRILPSAKQAAAKLGVETQALLAQAALETGWGKHQIKQSDGTPAYNVFGIKAGAAWNGATADVTTTEYVRGVAQQRVEKFRAYGSYEEAFQDYANLLQQAPRYRDVLHSVNTQTFAQSLQKAGYATDPQYAAKITRVAQNPILQAFA